MAANNPRVLITGATSGIGRELARIYAAQKRDLILVARNVEKLEELKKTWEEQYTIAVETISIDLSLQASAQKLYDITMAKNLCVGVLINNAGVGRGRSFATDSLSKNMSMVELNISSLVKLTHLFMQDMIKRDNGKILNVASVAAFQAGPYMSVYFATKAFVLSFTEALIEELRATNVQVSVLCPGATKTNFFADKSLRDSNLTVSMMNVEKVAQEALSGLEHGKKIVIPGFLNKLLVFSLRFMPRSLVMRLSATVLKPKNSLSN